MGRPPRKDDHGGEVYVYRRTGQPCHVCGKKIRTEVLVGRNLFWCPGCQPRFRSRATRLVKADMNRSTSPSLGRRLSRSMARMRRGTTPVETYWLVFLVALTTFLGTLVAVWPIFWPVTLLIVPMVLAHLVLGPRNLPWFVVFNLAVVTGLAVVVTTRLDRLNSRIVIGVAVIFVVGFIVLLTSFRRSRLGVGGCDRRVDAGRPARPDHEPGHAAGAAAGLVRRVGAAVRRRHAVRR